MLWIRGLIFTVLVPGIFLGLVPRWLRQGDEAAGGWWRGGWVVLAAALVLYFLCVLEFLLAGGTPALFFTRAIRFLYGEEPRTVVRNGLYRYSRNPMYISMVAVMAAEAVIYRSMNIAIYAALAAIFFYFVVVFLEEPHLDRVRGPDYQEYRRRVPRWLGRPRT